MALCRVCLVGNIRLLNLSNIHLAAYQKLTDNELIIKTEYDMPSKVCYVCHRQLQRFHMFSEMARKSNKILQDLLHNGTKVTHNALKLQPLNVVLNLTLAPTMHWSLGDTDTVAVKEPKIENNEEETFECEEYNTEESKLESLEDIDINDDFKETVLESDNNVIADMNNMHSCFNCDICNRIFYQKCDIVKHLQFHNKEKPYSCNICNRRFTNKKKLTRHGPIHTGEKPYSCNTCGMKFRVNSTLTRHMRIHNKVKPYSCEKCDRTFSQKQEVTKHMHIHTREKHYSCYICDKIFAHKQNMNIHMRIHNGVKPYSCNRCDKTFTQKQHLTHHMRIHMGVKPYSCNTCGMKFRVKGNIARHIMAIHTGQMVRECLKGASLKRK